jgi:hypothetical protein
MNETLASSIPTSSAEAIYPPLTQLQRVLYVFSAPTKTFTDILRSTSWWLPFLLSLVVGYAFIFTVQSKVGWDKVTANVMKQNPAAMERIDKLPPADRERQMNISKAFTEGISYAIPVASLLFAAIFSLVLWGTINFGFGGRATFGQVFAVWIYGGLPIIFQSILATVALFAGLDADAFNLNNPVGTNVGYYLSPDSPKWLMILGSAIDPIWIWAFALVGIGLAIVGRVKRSAGLIAVFGWWILLLAIRVVIAAVTG